MALPSFELVEEPVAPTLRDVHHWRGQLHALAHLWEISAHWAMSPLLKELDAHLVKLSEGETLPDDLAVSVRQARLSIQGLDADTAEPAMLRQYVFSCINELLVRAVSLRGSSKPGNHAEIPRVFVVDPRQTMAIACSIHMRAFGLNALSLLDGTELEKALTRWAPTALVAIADGIDNPVQFLELLKHWRTLAGGDCYCILLASSDTLQWRRLSVSARFDFFAAGQHAYHDMGVHINAWLAHQQQTKQIVLIGSSERALAPLQKQWTAMGVEAEAITDVSTAWEKIAAGQTDGVIVHGEYLQQHPDVLNLLRQTVSDETLWVADYPLGASSLDVQLLDDRRDAHLKAHLALSRRKFQRLLREEQGRFDAESGLLKLDALFDRALPLLQELPENEQVLVSYVRFEGLEERLPVDDPVQRAYMRQTAAAALLARLSPGDLLSAVSDQNYLMLLRIQGQRSLKAFSESLAHLPMAEGVTLKLGLAPVQGIHLARAIKEAVAGMHVPQKAEAQSPSKPNDADNAPNIDWTTRLKAAIQDKRLFLVFQSIVSLDNDFQERYEVLLRLKELDATIEPREFISIARQSGLIRYLDRWVVAEAMKTLKLRQAKIAKTGLFIKVSKESVLDPSFLPWMQRVITASGASMEQSAIEVEESVFFTHVGEGKVFIEKLRQMNVQVCIAQFGRSDASLNLIDYCAPAFIKLHRQYSVQLGQDKQVDTRFNDLVARAKLGGIHVLVGYLESTQALYRAVQTGAPLVQGNVLHRPSKVMEFDYSIIMKG